MAADPLRPNRCCTIRCLTLRLSVEFFGKGHKVSLQKTFQEIVSFHIFILLLLRCSPLTYSHPDKVKLTGNDTDESVAARFVDLTKAYKAYAVIYQGLPDLI